MRRGARLSLPPAVALLVAALASGQTPVPSPTPSPAAPPAAAPSGAAAAPAATPAAPREKIVGIRVVGYQTVSPDTIAHYLGVKA